MKLSRRLRIAMGVLFDATNWREIQRRPSETTSVRSLPDEVNTDDRCRLVSDSRKLYCNLGPVKGAVDAKAMYAVGRSWLPRFEGEDKAWGEQARAWLLDQFYPIADVYGRDFQTALYLASVGVDRDGDVGVILTEYDTGFPGIQLVPCNAIGTRDPSYAGQSVTIKSGPYKGAEEIDGVVLNAMRRPIAYHILGPDERGKQDEYVSVNDMALLMDAQWSDQLRGLPGFSHAILDLKDLRMVQGYEKMASALASSIGLIEYSETGLADMSDPALALSGGVVNSQTDIVSKEIFGGMVRHYKAGSGAKLESMKLDRPGDAWEKFMNRLIRNAMTGINWPTELAWDISALGGAPARFIISTAMRSVEDRQDLLRPVAKRAIGYACAKAVKQGILPPSKDWWRWGFTLPPRMTADFGRDAAAQRDDYLNGIINLTDICAERGEDIDVHIRERKEENDKLEAAGLPFPGSWGEVQTSEVQDAQAGQQPNANGKPDDDEEEDDEEDDQRQRGRSAEMAAATAANPLAALGVYEVRDDADFVRVPLGASFRDDTGEVRTKTIKL